MTQTYSHIGNLFFFAAGRDICLGVKWQSALNELVACKVVETHS